MNVGFAVCGSFCTFSKVFPIMELLSRDYRLTSIFSEAAYETDTRFGTAKEHIDLAQEICGTLPIHTIVEAEPIGPKKLFDILVIAPCTGNTLAKLAHGIADGPVTMAAKSPAVWLRTSARFRKLWKQPWKGGSYSRLFYKKEKGRECSRPFVCL